jgi:alginate O-acetyltransferase complex protein AlgI
LVLEGVQFFVIGLFRKLFIADYFAHYADLFFADSYAFGPLGAWLGILSYTFQIYFDFSAYSEMAIGLGKMLGFNFPMNFNSPYRAKSFSDFWKRWHITLSRFLRDYLYIPLGGNRNGKNRTAINLLLTMLIGGLWHGASWMFVIWGALHGFYLMVEKRIKSKWLKSTLFYQVAVFLAVCVAWIFFRSPNMEFAVEVLREAFFLNGLERFDTTYVSYGFNIPTKIKMYGGVKLLLALLLTFCIIRYVPNAHQIKIKHNWLTVILMSIIFAVCLSYVDKPSPFIYFQF